MRTGNQPKKQNIQTGEYYPNNFWDEKGEQLLKNGTGKVIRKFGPTEAEIFEQYFENGEYLGEKKISGAIYGKFKPKE